MPNKWKTYKLGEVATLQRGFDLPNTKRTDGKYPVIAASGFSTWHNEFKVKAPGVTTGRSGTLGQVHYVKDDFWPLNTSLWVKDFNGNDERFIYYFLQTLNFEEYNSGTSVPTLNRNDVHKLDVTIPDIPEQKSIASLISAIDDKIENNLAINKTLEEMAMALYKHWFVDFGPFQDGEFVESELGRIPKRWEVLSLQDVSTLTAGGDKPKNYSNHKTEDCGIPIYSNGITNEGLFGYTDIARIKEESITVSARGTIGFVCLRLEPYLPIVRLIAVVPKKEIVSSKYLFYWLKSQNINGNGTTQQQLTVPDFKVTNVLVPQIELINAFTEIVNPYYEKINSNKIENQNLTQLRDTLLPQLISGAVRLKEFRE
jgi:type I restriction enzyme S subunit